MWYLIWTMFDYRICTVKIWTSPEFFATETNRKLVSNNKSTFWSNLLVVHNTNFYAAANASGVHLWCFVVNSGKCFTVAGGGGGLCTYPVGDSRQGRARKEMTGLYLQTVNDYLTSRFKHKGADQWQIFVYMLVLWGEYWRACCFSGTSKLMFFSAFMSSWWAL